MKLDFMILANHAEEQGGLIYVSGGTWDTVNVNAPLQGGPPEAVALFQGFLVIRLLFHPTETGRDHSFELIVMDEDGHEFQKLGGDFRVEKNPNLPAGWEQGVNIIIGMSGMPLMAFGRFTLSLQVDGQHVGDRPFRVLKLY